MARKTIGYMLLLPVLTGITLSARSDEVIPDNAIVQGSVCVGFDCGNRVNFRGDAVLHQSLQQKGAGVVQTRTVEFSECFKPRPHATGDARMHFHEADIFHLPAPAMKSQTAGDGGVHVQRFRGDPASPFPVESLQVSHVIEAMGHA